MAVPDEANERVAISNNEQDLDIRIVYPDESVTVEEDPGAGRKSQALAAAKTSAVSLRLVAEIFPPTVEGEVVQATSIATDGGFKAMVSYNMRGAPRLGAVDWITHLHENRPRLRSSVVFTDSDISAVATDGQYVYAAVATNAPEFPFPAVFQRMQVVNDKFTLAENERVALTSYVATSVLPTTGVVYTTTGNTGEVAGFDKASLEPLGAFPLHDARWVAWSWSRPRRVRSRFSRRASSPAAR